MAHRQEINPLIALDYDIKSTGVGCGIRALVNLSVCVTGWTDPEKFQRTMTSLRRSGQMPEFLHRSGVVRRMIDDGLSHYMYIVADVMNPTQRDSRDLRPTSYGYDTKYFMQAVKNWPEYYGPASFSAAFENPNYRGYSVNRIMCWQPAKGRVEQYLTRHRPVTSGQHLYADGPYSRTLNTDERQDLLVLPRGHWPEIRQTRPELKATKQRELQEFDNEQDLPDNFIDVCGVRMPDRRR